MHQSKRRPQRRSGSYAYQPATRQLPQRTVNTSRHFKLPVIVIAGLLLVFGFHIVTGHSHVAAHELNPRTSHVSKIVTASPAALATLQSVIEQQETANSQLDLSVVSGSATANAPLQQFGTAAVFDAASTAKLLTAADYLHHVMAGQASLQTSIQGQTAQQLLQAMIVQSDDTAWLELNDYLTHNDLADYAASIGFEQYNVTDNTMPAYNSALLLQKLYSGKLLGSLQTELLLGYLKQANYRDYIVPALPAGYTIYHKVGINNDDVHDAAIIEHGNKAVVLTIYTNGHGTYDWPDRAAMMQTITRAVIQAYGL